MMMMMMIHDVFSNIILWGKNPNSRVNNSKVTDPIGPNFDLIKVFMPHFTVHVTCKFDKDEIKGN